MTQNKREHRFRKSLVKIITAVHQLEEQKKRPHKLWRMHLFFTTVKLACMEIMFQIWNKEILSSLNSQIPTEVNTIAWGTNPCSSRIYMGKTHMNVVNSGVSFHIKITRSEESRIYMKRNMLQFQLINNILWEEEHLHHLSCACFRL